MAERIPELWWRPTLLAAAMIALGRAIHINDSILDPGAESAIAWLTIAIGFAGVGIFIAAKFRFSRRTFQIVAIAGVLFNCAQLATKPSDSSLHMVGVGISPITTGAIVTALLGAFTLVATGTFRLLGFVGLLLGTAVLGSWIIVTKAEPVSDVYMFQTDSSAALAAGRDPYAITFPDIYGPPYSWYGKDVVSHGRLQFGYPYMPETLLAILPAKLLGFDFRWMQLGAMILTAVAIVAIRPDLVGYSATTLLITTPRIFYVLGIGYTEPFATLALAATVVASARWPRVLPIALGVFLASKQYTVIAIPLVFVGSRPWRNTVSSLIKATSVAAVVTLPLVLWNVRAFWRSAVILQFRQPFRTDALSYLAWANAQLWPKWMLIAIPFGLLVLTIGLVLRQRQTIGFGAAAAICFLIFFAFNKQAFANYYFFDLAAMACAVAEHGFPQIVGQSSEFFPENMEMSGMPGDK